MKLMFRSFAVGLALLSSATAATSDASAPVTEFFGEITDPAGDSVRSGSDPSSDPAPDLVYASALAADGQLQLSVRFAPGTFAGDTTFLFTLDTDSDPATGFPGTTGGVDVGIMGPDYILRVRGFAFGNEVLLSKFTGPPTVFTLITTDLDITLHEDGADVMIPLALLDDDDGRLHFKVTTQVQFNATGTNSGICDWLSDPGLQPGSTVPADEEITDLGGAIAGLESEGTLNHGPAQALGNHLENALRSLDAGHTAAARAQLEAFIEQVLGLVADGTLTEEAAAPLLGTAERVLAGL